RFDRSDGRALLPPLWRADDGVRSGDCGFDRASAALARPLRRLIGAVAERGRPDGWLHMVADVRAGHLGLAAGAARSFGAFAPTGHLGPRRRPGPDQDVARRF